MSWQTGRPLPVDHYHGTYTNVHVTVVPVVTTIVAVAPATVMAGEQLALLNAQPKGAVPAVMVYVTPASLAGTVAVQLPVPSPPTATAGQ
jgi:hypothetical protein